MANPYRIDITARDRTAEALKSVNDNFEKLARGTPLERVQKGFAGLQEKGRAFGELSKIFGGVGDSSRLAAGGIGEAAGGLAELGGLAGVAGLAVAGVGAAAVGAAAAAIKFQADYSQAGAHIGRFSEEIGVGADQLQAFELAGRHVGVSAGAMDAALQNVGNTMEDALAGRNQAALMLMNRLGIQLHHTASGAIDSARAFQDVSRAMQGQSPEVRQLIANQFGVGGAFDFANLKISDQQKLLDEATRSGAIRSKQQIADDETMVAKMSDMDDEWHRVLNALSTQLIIPWLKPLLDGLEQALGLERQVIDGAQHKEVAASFGDIANGDATVDWSTGMVVVKDGANVPGVAGYKAGGGSSGGALPALGAGGRGQQATTFFEQQGWSKEQAAGIVANLFAESRLNDRAVGDHGQAYGAGQWHADRQAEFANWAGHSIMSSSFAEQLRFVQYELTQGMRRKAGDILRHASTATGAGAVVSRYYESPRDVAGEAGRRGALAEHLVHVEVHLTGAPAGTKVATRTSSPAVTAGAKIAPSLPGPSV